MLPTQGATKEWIGTKWHSTRCCRSKMRENGKARYGMVWYGMVVDQFPPFLFPSR